MKKSQLRIDVEQDLLSMKEPLDMEFFLKKYKKRKSYLLDSSFKNYIWMWNAWMRKKAVKGEKPKAEKVKKPVEEIIKDDLKLIRIKAEHSEFKRKYEASLKELEMANLRFDALVQIKEEVQINEIEPLLSQHDKHEGVPIISLSDWHFEEKVEAHTINGLNEYNLEIAAERWSKCIQNSLKLVAKERHTTDIEQIVIWLGGDFITGYIHEELVENNYLSPTQATRFAKEKIITALNFYKRHGRFKKITVACNYGNHGRTTQKPRISSGYKNSYEWMMYQDIADYFSNDKMFNFIIANGEFNYLKMFDKVIRTFHGDSIKFNGGIGGLTIPLIKAIGKMNQQIQADYNFMGHYHQFWEATKDCLVNGSGIGFGPYAMYIKALPEEPMQGFKMLDSKHGFTTKLAIRCK